MFLQQGLVILLISKTIFAYTSSICAQVPNGYFVRSSQSCSSYNRCNNGQPSHGICPKGYSFNPLSQACSHNIDVNCQLCSSYGIQNIPHPDNCAMYYRCANGVRTTMTCPNDLLFDRYFGDCNIAQRVICEARNTICEQFRELDWLGSILIGNPLDCSSYYYCINGNAVVSVCPNGLYFNPHTATCEVRGAMNFCQGLGPIITTPIPEFSTYESWTTPSTTISPIRYIYVTRTSTDAPTEPTTERSTTVTTTSTSTATTTETTSTTTEEPSTTLEPSTDYPFCPAVPLTGYYPMPYPDNCTRYYYCSRGVARSPINCARGQFFTPGSDRCTDSVPPGCEHLVEAD